MSEYVFLIVPIVSLILCQVIKFLFELIVNKQLDFSRLFNGMGGIPSSHSAFCFSLTFTIGFELGFNSSLFAIALVFSIIVAYDAMRLRKEVEKHAIVLNGMNKDKKLFKIKLNEQVGHEVYEVLSGIGFGFVIAYFCSLFL